eukprot:COSAG06_NODE_26846_length_606_cov_1.175542_1_plen_43_part_10
MKHNMVYQRRLGTKRKEKKLKSKRCFVLFRMYMQCERCKKRHL